VEWENRDLRKNENSVKAADRAEDVALTVR